MLLLLLLLLPPPLLLLLLCLKVFGVHMQLCCVWGVYAALLCLRCICSSAVYALLLLKLAKCE